MHQLHLPQRPLSVQSRPSRPLLLLQSPSISAAPSLLPPLPPLLPLYPTLPLHPLQQPRGLQHLLQSLPQNRPSSWSLAHQRRPSPLSAQKLIPILLPRRSRQRQIWQSWRISTETVSCPFPDLPVRPYDRLHSQGAPQHCLHWSCRCRQEYFWWKPALLDRNGGQADYGKIRERGQGSRS